MDFLQAGFLEPSWLRYAGLMAVFQCPACELRFALAAELDDHLDKAHPDFKVEHDSLEDELLAQAKRRKKERDR
jgi:hypothetical protein